MLLERTVTIMCLTPCVIQIADGCALEVVCTISTLGDIKIMAIFSLSTLKMHDYSSCTFSCPVQPKPSCNISLEAFELPTAAQGFYLPCVCHWGVAQPLITPVSGLPVA